jgi:small subunit ribosomal protein S1
MILDIDTERRRISLGMKQCTPNPWEEFAATHNKGDRITGKIKSITDFGVFIGLEGGIDGLIHLSDLAWDRPGEEVVRDYKKGDDATAVVLSVDPERERISLGIKQAMDDPFAAYVSEHGKGSVVGGTVSSVDAKGAVISLADGVEGYLRATELSRDHVEDARTVLKEGDRIDSKVTSIERKNRRISLSVKALDVDMEDKAMQEYTRKSSVSGPTTLGEKLKEQLQKQDS